MNSPNLCDSSGVNYFNALTFFLSTSILIFLPLPYYGTFWLEGINIGPGL